MLLGYCLNTSRFANCLYLIFFGKLTLFPSTAQPLFPRRLKRACQKPRAHSPETRPCLASASNSGPLFRKPLKICVPSHLGFTPLHFKRRNSLKKLISPFS